MPQDLAPQLHIPRHIAIVMDGNGRWAKKRHLPRLAGHKQGVEALRQIVTSCHDLGVGALTVFAFSSENWKRPQEEVSGLLELMGLALARETPRLQAKGVRMHFDANVLRIACNNAEQEEAVDELEIEYSGEPIEIGFNVTYLIDALNNISQEMVSIALQDGNNSALLTVPENSEFKYVVMPMRI